MLINTLYLFSKNTDAASAQRGYNFQTLKTLETWVDNFISNNREDIYCEFEDDIFQLDRTMQTVKFRQIKLYSGNFSFKSEEISKSICHFFTLHVKADYNDFSKTYVFETNTTIAGKYLDNDAELLREWFQHQDRLDGDKIIRLAEKVKAIVSGYVKEQKRHLKENPALENVVKVFEALPSSFWQDFVKTIKWKFAGTSPEQEFLKTRANIEALLEKLPYNFLGEDPVIAFGVLLDKVFGQINEEDGQKRKLTRELLEQTILGIGNEQDKWYARNVDYYRHLEPLEDFRIGEYSEILDLSNYCRRKKYLHGHKDVWNPLLTFYARNEGIAGIFRRKAIYELLFLNNEFYEVDYDNLGLRARPDGDLRGYEDDINYYFSDCSAFGSAEELENAHTIVSLLFPAIENKKVGIPLDMLRKWFVSLYWRLHRLLQTVLDISERCNLLEVKGTRLMTMNWIRPNKSQTVFVKYFEEILKIADMAPLFNVLRFGERIEKYLKMQLQHDPQDKLGVIEVLEDFSERLFPLLEKREGKKKLAKAQVERGMNYCKTRVPKNLLRALDYFHRAKDNYLMEDTIEGFILVALNIGNLYDTIGMHFAAKNYALAAFRMSSNRQLIKRVEDSLHFLAYADFKSGAWINSLLVYGKYFRLRAQSNADHEDLVDEEKASACMTFILYVMERNSSQFKYFTASYVSTLDKVSVEIASSIRNQLQRELADDQKFAKVLNRDLDDYPLNDAGKERIVQFHALGSLWKLTFANDYDLLAPAEEFIAFLQTALAEIALAIADFHLVKSTIEIELCLGKSHTEPEQLASNEAIKWKVYVYFSNAMGQEINHHSAVNLVSLRYVLNNISLLDVREFDQVFERFFREASLDTKQIALNLYQKIHRDAYGKDDFEALQSRAFIKEEFHLQLPRENKVMEWNSSLSSKYNRDFSLNAIKNRFDNLYKNTHLTMERLKKEPGFVDWIKGLRALGWKDWQIMVNLQNFMINYKIRRFEKSEFKSQQAYAEHVQKMYSKYANMDERECNVAFPLKAFQTEEFLQLFNVSSLAVMKTYGLETKMRTPNFTAIKEFLDIRFNLQYDDYNDNNPLRDIL